jgi:S-adenosylmethionine hydrolase
MSIIALMTDFGTKDGNVGVMKGVIAGINPDARLIDLSHGITPQNVREAALILSRTCVYFPAGTIFLVVVDPGVGTSRRPIGAKVGQYYFILPDNGILTPLLSEARENQTEIEIVHLDQPGYWLTNVSNVFHGRDIFAPCAAFLSKGIPLRDLGSLISDPVILSPVEPQRTETGLTGEVIHVDHFGNISTTIRKQHLNGVEKLLVRLNDYEIKGLYRTFGELPAGSLMALLGSTDYLIISEVNGNAARHVGAKPGDPVEVVFLPGGE